MARALASSDEEARDVDDSEARSRCLQHYIERGEVQRPPAPFKPPLAVASPLRL